MPYIRIGEQGDPENGLDRIELRMFQKWIVRRHERFRSFEEFKAEPEARALLHEAAKSDDRALDLFELM